MSVQVLLPVPPQPSPPPRPASIWQARAWMAWTLAGVLLSVLAAFVLAPIRALHSE